MAEIERIEAYQGNQMLPLAESFTISGDPSQGRIDFEGDLADVDFIGYGMSDGESTSTVSRDSMSEAR